MKIKDIFERRKAFDSIKSKFYEHVISVLVQENTPPIENGFYYVPFEALYQFYDKETGYKTKTEFLLW